MPEIKMRANGAKRRAEIVAFLEREGTPQTLAQIMAGTAIPESSVQNFASGMAKSGLIGRGRQGPAFVYFAKRAPATELLPATQAPKPVKAVKHVTQHASATQLNGSVPAGVPAGVELAVAGMVVVFGRNPATGRLRITLDAPS